MRECDVCRLRTDSLAPSCPVCRHPLCRPYVLGEVAAWKFGLTLLIPFRLVAVLLG